MCNFIEVFDKILFCSSQRLYLVSAPKSKDEHHFFLQVLNSTRKFRQFSIDHVVVHILEKRELILSLSVEDMSPM